MTMMSRTSTWLPTRSTGAFTGASAAIGLHADTWRGGAFVANFSRSFRAPALEELYNFGPHAGNRAFEVGNPALDPEIGNGIDFSVRHEQGRVQGEFNFFYYDFDNFIFPYATGEEVDELLEIEFTQRSARFTGAEANLDIGLHDNLRLNLGMDLRGRKGHEYGNISAADPAIARKHRHRLPQRRLACGSRTRDG